MGKEFQNEYTCICITESLCYTPETNMTLLINYAPIKKKKAGTTSSLRNRDNKGLGEALWAPRLRFKPLQRGSRYHRQPAVAKKKKTWLRAQAGTDLLLGVDRQELVGRSWSAGVTCLCWLVWAGQSVSVEVASIACGCRQLKLLSSGCR